jgi:hypothetical protein
MKNTDETIICHVPIKFEILTSGKAKNEAKVIKQSLHSSLLGGRTASLVNVVSSSTDNAAKATSRELAELKLAEIVEIKKCIDDQLTQYPERLIAARDAWLAMSPKQQECARKMHILSCTGHGENLTIDDWQKVSKQQFRRTMFALVRLLLFSASFNKSGGKLSLSSRCF